MPAEVSDIAGEVEGSRGSRGRAVVTPPKVFDVSDFPAKGVTFPPELDLADPPPVRLVLCVEPDPEAPCAAV